MKAMAFDRWRWLGLVLALALGAAALWLAAGRGVSAPGPRILFTELRGDRSILWLATARDPKERAQLAEIPHRYGFGLRAQLSPDGRRLAYTLVPPGAQDPATQAVLGLLDVESGKTQELVSGIDARGIPIWSPQGDQVIFQRLEPRPEQADRPGRGDVPSLWVVEATGQGERQVARDEAALGLYPAGWSDDTVYFARIDKGGTDLMALDLGALSLSKGTPQAQGTPASSAPRRVAHLSDGVARDFRLSPDGRRLAFTAPPTSNQGEVYSLAVADLTSGQVTTLASEANDHLSPVWRPSSQEVTYNTLVAPVGVQSRVVGGEVRPKALPAPRDGFDLPLSWSSDGAYLAVRYLRGASSQSITSERLTILAEEGGQRWEVDTSGYTQFLGWREG